MWNESLELHTARRLEQNNSVTLEPGLELRPEIFDARRGAHSPALVVFLERGRELSDAGDDICARCQCETRDIGVALLRCRAQLPHRSKDDYPLPSGTSPPKQIDSRTG